MCLAWGKFDHVFWIKDFSTWPQAEQGMSIHIQRIFKLPSCWIVNHYIYKVKAGITAFSSFSFHCQHTSCNSDTQSRRLQIRNCLVQFYSKKALRKWLNSWTNIIHLYKLQLPHSFALVLLGGRGGKTSIALNWKYLNHTWLVQSKEWYSISWIFSSSALHSMSIVMENPYLQGLL